MSGYVYSDISVRPSLTPEDAACDVVIGVKDEGDTSGYADVRFPLSGAVAFVTRMADFADQGRTSVGFSFSILGAYADLAFRARQAGLDDAYNFLAFRAYDEALALQSNLVP